MYGKNNKYFVIYSPPEILCKLVRMSLKIFKYLVVSVFISISIPGISQEPREGGGLPVPVGDSLRKSGIIFNEKRVKPEIVLSTDEAIRFLRQRTKPEYWKNLRDPLRIAIGQLVFEASHLPYDSAEVFIRSYPFDSLDVSWDQFYIWEPLNLKIPVVVPPVSPIPVDTIALADTVRTEILSDSAKVIDLQIPEIISSSRPVAKLKDTTILVVIDTLSEVSSHRPDFPFTYYEYPYQSDSIKVAVNSLLDFVQARDSSIINFVESGTTVTPVWLNSRSGMMRRLWLKTDMEDSVTVWVGAQGRNTIGIYLENGISFSRPVRQGNYSDARIEMKEIDKSKLLDVKKITVKSELWKYRSEAAFALNQASMANWVKGGESSISTSLDITGYADYLNKPLNITSNNFGRIKYGLIALGEKKEVRKNLDLLETNSKVNHKAFGKFDFSAILLFKTQIAKGYNYPNDSVVVSKFFNPAIITTGFGLDYKPNKNTSINFSPFSYKGTFVPDTSVIDQTKYGIAKDKRSKNEPGASFLISHLYKPFKTVSITNRLQLFTNYINNPQNIDIDWEMILTASLNWFTDVRFNTHLIFDDDTKTPTLDKENKPVLGSDGKPKKSARIQFKELLGFSFIFRF